LVEKFNKPGAAFLGLVHRLDMPVSGIMCFARTSKAAARISAQFRSGGVCKKYYAVVEGAVASQGSELEGVIVRQDRHQHVLPLGSKAGKYAKLSWRALARCPAHRRTGASSAATRGGGRRPSATSAGRGSGPAGPTLSPPLSLLEVTLGTGRKHQIRAQLSDMGHPIVGDVKYGASSSLRDGRILLHAHSLAFAHPTSKEPQAHSAPVPRQWQGFCPPGLLAAIGKADR
jgi:23S rRNA pseudouridine1911/1915/1917 synthase